MEDENEAAYESHSKPALTSSTQATNSQEVSSDNDFSDELVFPIFSKQTHVTKNASSSSEQLQQASIKTVTTEKQTTPTSSSEASPSPQQPLLPQYEDLSDEAYSDNTEEYLITLTTQQKKEPDAPLSSKAAVSSSTSSTSTITTTVKTTSRIVTTNASSADSLTTTPGAVDLCNDPEIDDITRTEWGNAFIFKGIEKSLQFFFCSFFD